MKNFFIVVLIAIFVNLSVLQVSSAEMTSTNYYIYADAISVGGIYSTSTSHSLEDTVGETTGGVFTTSTTYEVRGGYQAMEKGILSMAISNYSLNLGNLSQVAVDAASTVATITTDSSTGYALSIGSVSGSAIASVSDGSVTMGFEEYGVAVAGADAAFANDRGVSAGLALASSSGAVTSRETTLTFKASISGSTSTGSRSQSITLIASANF